MSDYTGVDYFGVEERLVRETVRAFVDREVIPDHRAGEP